MSEYYNDKMMYENYLKYQKSINDEEKDNFKILINLKLQEIISDIDGLYIAKHLLMSLRHEGFRADENLEISSKIDIKDNLNNSINNLIFKYVQQSGYFKKLQDILDEKAKWKEMVDAT
jgi:hypothetical protein